LYELPESYCNAKKDGLNYLKVMPGRCIATDCFERDDMIPSFSCG